jgi:hypothetical protein
MGAAWINQVRFAGLGAAMAQGQRIAVEEHPRS